MRELRRCTRSPLLGALAAVTLLGCGATPTSSATPGENANGGAGAETPAAEALPQGMDYGVRWTEVQTETPGCFFFSGPGELGRDTQLGEAAAFAIGERRARLDFGGGAVFEGERAGEGITLERSSTHDFDGKWTVRETIRLHLAPAGGWIGRYHYDEYSPGESSPSTCHIDANVLLGL
jgi:hypothetical protein